MIAVTYKKAELPQVHPVALDYIEVPRASYAGDLEFARQLGADQVIDYTATRFEDEVGKVDVMFDTVGGETLRRSWSVLQAAGQMVTIAADSEGSSDQRVKNAFFIVEPNHDQLAGITGLIDVRHMKIFVKAVVPLDAAAAAYDGSLGGKGGRGKIVISVPT